jgi:hypothetical protein
MARRGEMKTQACDGDRLAYMSHIYSEDRITSTMVPNHLRISYSLMMRCLDQSRFLPYPLQFDDTHIGQGAQDTIFETTGYEPLSHLSILRYSSIFVVPDDRSVARVIILLDAFDMKGD